MKGFKISDTLTLPPDAVTQAIAALARKGAGKTYTGKVFAEEIIAAKVPTVILDPTGAWWGLRSSADGEKPGLPVTILGGAHGDVPLEPSKGVMVADVVIDYPGAYILDISAFESRRAEVIFAAAFLERLYRRKQPATGPMMLIVDEADVFAPQRPGPEATKSLGALESIVRRGRIKGLGDMLLTQRAAVLNKNVLTQTECLIVLQTTGPQDRAAIREWIEGNADTAQSKTILDSLASLERGEAWVWSPSWLRKLVKIQVRQAKTFDSSRTPEPGETIAPKAFAKVDLEKLGAEMAAAVEKAKADDPKELRRRILQLEQELRATTTRPPETVERVVERIVDRPVPFLEPALRKTIEDLVRNIGDRASTIARLAGEIDSAMAADTMRNLPPEVAQPVERPVEGRKVAGSTPALGTMPRAAQPVDLNGTGPKIGKGERTVLGVLRQYPAGRTYNELAFLAGYSANASTLGVILSKLRQLGLIAPGNQPVVLTDAGIEAAGGIQEMPTGQELLNQWLSHPRMGKGERDVLQILIGTYPRDLSNDELCELSGYSPTASTIGVILSKLRKLGLVDKGARRLASEFAEAIELERVA